LSLIEETMSEDSSISLQQIKLHCLVAEEQAKERCERSGGEFELVVGAASDGRFVASTTRLLVALQERTCCCKGKNHLMMTREFDAVTGSCLS
jgi:hypothetical protein